MTEKKVKEIFRDYFEDLGYLSIGHKDRINLFFNHYSDYILKKIKKPEEIKKIFISNIVNEDNKIEFENLWLFTENFACEITRFDLEDNYDIAFYKNSIIRIQIKKENFSPEYNLGNTSKDSRLYIEASIKNKLDMIFKASDINCKYLYLIFEEILLPNMQTI